MKRSRFSANDGSANDGSGHGGNAGGSGGANVTAEESACRTHVRYLGAFLDGELDAGKQIDVEEHLASCETCRERTKLDCAMRSTLKKVVGEDAHEAAAVMTGAEATGLTATGGVAGMDAMRARMRAAMNAETTRSESSATGQPAGMSKASNVHAAPFGWRAMLPLTAAAALSLVWGAASQRAQAVQGRSPFATSIPSAISGTTAQAGMGEDPLADLVAEHSRPLPPEQTNAHDMQAFEQYVGVPVHAANLEKAGARLVGGRVLPVHQERAAMLQYVVGKGADARRISMFIYDPRKIRVGCADCAPRTAGTAEVQVGRAGGYSVAVTQKEGVGYALASDLGPERSFELAALVDSD